MKLCDVKVTYPHPEDAAWNATAPTYRDISAETDDHAIAAAQKLHSNANRRFAGSEFTVVRSVTVLCPTALPEAA